MNQLAFVFSPCACGPTVPPALMEYSGFKRTFTTHDWCEKFYVGKIRDDGSIESCRCEKHSKPKEDPDAITV